MSKSDFTGVILAGGQSSRFGSNKALTEFQGRRLVEHPAQILEEIFTKRLLVTNSPADYKFLGWPMTPDIFPGKGPLAGIHAALNTVSTPYIFVVGCDMPFPSSTLISFLCKAAPGVDGVIPLTDRGPEPLHSVYAKTALPVLEKNLHSDNLKIREVLNLMNTRIIERDEVKLIIGLEKPFRNINTLSDLNEQ